MLVTNQEAAVVLELKNVVKTFGAVRALDGLDLAVRRSEAVALVGPSGCGKTTALRLLNGLETPEVGEVLVEGKRLETLDIVQHRRQTGYVIQEIGLLPHWTVSENIATVLRLEKAPQAERVQRANTLLSAVGLDETHAKRRPRALSGGQRQRVGIARALCAGPRFLLMDEPLGAVDPLTRVELRRLLRKLRRTENFTMVLVTHDLDDARALCDRVCVLRHGKLVETLDPGALEKATDPWVREFVAPAELG